MTKNFNKDIMNWSTFPDYDILWCDPPWEQRLVKWFETMQYKQAKIERPNNTIEGIIKQLGKLSSKNKPLLVEYGMKGYDLVIRILTEQGHKHLRIIHLTQVNGNPYVLLVFNKELKWEIGKGFQTITRTLLNHQKSVVFDPFAGIGNSAKAVRAANCTYIGSELNPVRFEQLKKINT